MVFRTQWEVYLAFPLRFVYDKDIHILIDRGILEIYANHGTMNVYYETDSDVLCGKIVIKGGKGTGRICTWKP